VTFDFIVRKMCPTFYRLLTKHTKDGRNTVYTVDCSIGD
jgi:hypothetical protein